MCKMRQNCLHFTIFALWMHFLVLPQRAEGLSCFSCDSKTSEGCKNEDLKSGHRNNMFSKRCLHSDSVCVKQSVTVKDYYEEHYSRVEMDKYYAQMDDAAKCRGIGASAAPAVTSAPGGQATTAGSGGGAPGGTAAAGSGGGGAGPADTTPAAPTETTTGAADSARRRRRSVAENCPAYPNEFPKPHALVERHDRRWAYSCGNRSAWYAIGFRTCHTHSDGIVHRTTCLCDEDLCNAATVSAAGPFLVLAAALLHLRGVLG